MQYVSNQLCAYAYPHNTHKISITAQIKYPPNTSGDWRYFQYFWDKQ